MGLTSKGGNSPTFSGNMRIEVPTLVYSGKVDSDPATSINPYTGTGPGLSGSGLTRSEIENYRETDQLLSPTSFDTNKKGSNLTLSNNDLTVSTTDNIGAIATVYGTSSGKWYWEITQDNRSGYGAQSVGVVTNTIDWDGNLVGPAGAWTYIISNDFDTSREGDAHHDGNIVDYGNAVNIGDTVGIALDLDNGAIWFSINDTWQGGATISEIESGDTTNAAHTGITGTLYAAVSSDGSLGDFQITANFGQNAFQNTVPEGFAPGFGSTS